MSRGALGLGLVALVGCVGPRPGQVRRASRALSQAAATGDDERIRPHLASGTRGRVDTGALSEGGRKGPWARALAHPEVSRLSVLAQVGPREPVEIVRTEEGWVFAEDPTALYRQDTPRQALRALVRASRAGRWDVLLRLAPRRYRIGLSEERLRAAWREGPSARDLSRARDQLARHLDGPIAQDDHEAVLDMGEDGRAYLEREGARWVVVDF